ncbi:MAG: GMC family oxidoreductase [Xanthobacteraceae bacterium]
MPGGQADTYDHIIVGAGSAGCVLANRLSADPNIRVCLIEAGPRDRHPFIHVPLGVMGLFKHPRLNWRFETTRQEGAGDRAIYIPRGKTLGGSSSINGMIYTRGHPTDYDEWAAAGNPGWAFKDVLPYFRRSENNERWRDSPYHGTGGELNVAEPHYTSKLSHVFFDAAASMQIPKTDDFCGPTNEGYGIRQLTQKDGKRHSTAAAFLAPARNRKNLDVITNAIADHVLFDNGRAAAVRVLHGGMIRTVAARREIILSGGAIASPMILMRSGIGDAAELKRHGITVLKHLPQVGKNLQDHIAICIQYENPSNESFGLSLRTSPKFAWGVIEYLLRRRGLLAGNIMQAGAFIKTDPSLSKPDIQLVFNPARRSPSGVVGIGHGFGLFSVVLRPKSRGEVGLSGPDAAAPPVIDPRFFSDPADMDVLLRGLKLTRRIIAAPAFDPHRGDEIAPGVGVQTDDGLRDFIRKACGTVYHPVGTCRMGSDAGAAVDPQLRVRGVAGLRVVDASIMPTIVGGNTNAPVIMIAEKAADMILSRAPPPRAH